MDKIRSQNYLLNYIEQLQARGRYSFTLEEIQNSLDFSALKDALKLLIKKGKIVSIRRGFYIIVPPEYSSSGILPPSLFINDMMKYINKPYYVGLLSAAALHGAAHQQPQEFYVVTRKPPNRSILKKGLKINFIIKSEILKTGIEEKKTDTGYIQVSTPELTAIDLIQYANRIGGFNRVATVLHELADEIDINKFKEILETNISITILQRLGYILEKILNLSELSNIIFNELNKKHFFRVPLNTNYRKQGFTSNNRWKVIENSEIESDL